MKKFLFILILLISSSPIFAQKKVRSAIREGNKQYNDSAFLDSEISYRKALEVNPVDSIAIFNLGNSLYRQQDEKKINEALSQYVNTAQAAHKGGNKQLASKSFYNAGDIMMAGQQYDKAIQMYKQALKDDPTDNDARYNLILAQKLLKQQQNQDQNKDQNKDQDKKDQDKQDQQQQQQNQQNQDQNKDQDKQDQQNQDQQQQQNQDQQQQQQQGQMSKEQAEAILNANNRDEKDTQEKVQQKLMQQVKKKQTTRDW